MLKHFLKGLYYRGCDRRKKKQDIIHEHKESLISSSATATEVAHAGRSPIDQHMAAICQVMLQCASKGKEGDACKLINMGVNNAGFNILH